MKKIDREINHVVFQPTFGNRPNQYIGRDYYKNNYMEL